jgi:hypothetical protein
MTALVPVPDLDLIAKCKVTRVFHLYNSQQRPASNERTSLLGMDAARHSPNDS